MNEHHAKLCSSPEWAEHLQTDILTPLARDVDLGAEMVEVGPGPGAATDWLRHRVARLVVVEFDEVAAEKLVARFAGTNVEVVHGDATAMTFGDGSFDSAGSFTMLHHVATFALQNRLLAEILRVLRAGGVLIGSDSRPSDELHRFHDDDTYNPIEPGTLMIRLQTLGYERITVGEEDRTHFVAHKPVPS
ncbi:MAG: class I SAM-dependent methyltransferase [Acidimicrobiales bacterium]